MNWLENALSPALVRALGWTLVHSLWQGAVVGLALVGLLLVLRRHSAQVRYNVACVALATMLGLAMVTFIRHYAIALVSADTTLAAGASGGATAAAPAAAPDFLGASATTAGVAAASGVQSGLQYFDHNLPLIVAAWLLGLLGRNRLSTYPQLAVDPAAGYERQVLGEQSTGEGVNRDE